MVIETNPYFCLGLTPSSSPAEIKRRYRQLAKQYHPDLNGHAEGSEEKLREINAAYAFLSDSTRKAAYDASLAAVFNPVRVPQRSYSVLSPSALYVPHRRHTPARVVAGIAMLMLLSTGVGVLFSAVNSSPFLTGLFAQVSGKPSGPDRPAPVYSFMPNKSTFGDQDTSSTPAPPAPEAQQL